MDDLKSDEEIFADKEKEINKLKEIIDEVEAKLSTANRYLEVSFSKEKEQQELMLQLQIQLDKLMQNRPESNNVANTNDPSLFKNQNQGFSSNPSGETGVTRKGSNVRLQGSIFNQNSFLSNNMKQRAKTAPNEIIAANQQNGVQVCLNTIFLNGNFEDTFRFTFNKLIFYLRTTIKRIEQFIPVQRCSL